MMPNNEVPVKRRRTRFSNEERHKILEFITASKSFHKVGGTLLWKKMASQLLSHSWQSIRQHFHRKIKPNIEAYKVESLEVSLFKSKADKCERTGVKELGRYTAEEDRKIVDYINNKFTASTRLSGNKFSEKMQRSATVPGRSWQSMRQRYLKHLKRMAVMECQPDMVTKKFRDYNESANDKDELDHQAVRNEQGNLYTQAATSKSDLSRSVGLASSKRVKRKLFTLNQDFDF